MNTGAIISQSDQIPFFNIGPIPINGNIILAPMDGFSDQPFRSICREMGSAVTYTEFINVLDVPRKLPYIQQRIAFAELERPLGFQLYGSSADEIIPAAMDLLKYKPDFFDLNLGCSERRVARRGAGAGLLKFPEKIERIVRQLIQTAGIPVTAKIRLGWEKESMNYIEISKLLQDCGISLIAVHGRTRDQRWREPALWEPIAEICGCLSIPVIGNGDIKSIDDIDRMITQTGCDGVMVGRGAIGNPWIFSRIDKAILSRIDIIKMIKMHWKRVKDFYEFESSHITFNKHFKAYLSCPQFTDINIKQMLFSKQPIDALLANL